MKRTSNRFRLLLIAVLVVWMLVPLQAFASPYTSEPPLNLPEHNLTAPRVDDAADLISDETEEKLATKIAAIREKYQSDVVFATTNSTNGVPIQEYADDYYDYTGFGVGEGRDGVLLMIAIESRDVAISTTGTGIYAITDYGVDHLFDKIVPYLSDDDFDRASIEFVDEIDRMFAQAATGKPVDIDTPIKSTVGESILFALKASPFGLLIFGILGFVKMKAETAAHKNAVRQNFATAYLSANHIFWGRKDDVFQDQRITRRKIQVAAPVRSNSSSGGGSTTHRSSSGQRHGGGSRKF